MGTIRLAALVPVETSPLPLCAAAARQLGPVNIEPAGGLSSERPHLDAPGSRELPYRPGAIIWEADPLDLRTIFVSREAEQLLGYPLQAWHEDVSFLEHALHPNVGAEALTNLRRAAGEGGDHVLELCLLASDGRAVSLHVFLHSVCDSQGRPRSLYGVMVDAGSPHPDAHANGTERLPEIPSSGASVPSTSDRGVFPLPPRSEVPPQPGADLNLTLRSLETTLRAELGPATMLRLSLEAGPTPVPVEPGALARMVRSLVRYAQSSMLEGGELTIETSLADGGEGARRLLLTCVDSGQGLDALRKASASALLFDRRLPERETKNPLETVEETVAGAGGSIEIRTEPGAGTRLEIGFPLD
jgi:hypothetical protein